MTKLLQAALVLMTFTLSTSAVYADHGRQASGTENLLRNIAAAVLVGEAVQPRGLNRSQRSRGYRNHGRGDNSPARGFGNRHSNRDGYGGASYTSEPIRGGSSRRTRIVENPYPNRAVTGISFTGIERNAVHINDVITYPRKRLISRSGYSLSLYHPSQFLNTRGYVDYISVKAKRREHFTVTFHYD